MENKQILNELVVSAAPHIRSSNTVRKEMLNVIIALLPALGAGIYFFGIQALLVTLVTVASCVLSEYAYQKILHKPITVGDCSAIVTGILLAFNVPVSMPLPMMILGGAFAIIIVKQLFGGIGANFMNPALGARAFLMASWSSAMSHYTLPHTDMTSAPTFLSGAEKAGIHISLWDAFIGNMGGCIGEVSIACLLIGAAYLLYKKVIQWHIPVIYIASTAVVLMLCGIKPEAIPMQILSGGLILGAFFMATDYVTCPISFKGQVIFAVGCGVFTALIRVFGALPEGVSYAILVMNIASPLIEKLTIPKPFGRGGVERK